MPKIVERIGALEERLKQLKAKQQKIDARKRALESRQARQADRRRKFLAGAIVLAKVEQDALANVQFRKWLEEALVREDDRALFDLPPVTGEQPAENRATSGDQNTAAGEAARSAPVE